MKMLSTSPHNVSAVLNATADSTAVTADTYFRNGEHSSLMLSHIGIMTVAWLFMLPMSVMLSIGRSNLTLLSQLVFLCMNGLGLLLGTIYNAQMPDLYENNLHHKLGWIVTGVASVQAILGLFRAFAGAATAKHEIPISQYQSLQGLREEDSYRYSRESANDSEATSPGSPSLTSLHKRERAGLLGHQAHDVHDIEKRAIMHDGIVNRFLSQHMPWIANHHALNVVNFFYNFIDRIILILGFLAITTGLVTYGGFFKGHQVFSGLAHFVKGGIFFWYGLFSLGRYMGSFADFGWAWNVKPSSDIVGSRKAAIPSAEFVESFLIFFYGSTNAFLEHLGGWGGEWTATDLEHTSIAIMFFGGGLCGMLVESKRIWDLLNSAFLSTPFHHGVNSSAEAWQPPKTYNFSLNPIPGIIILLLGIMMSSHHQASMVSTMVHKQWGTLLVGAAFARGVTYILTYLSPPTSLFPSRPPSELVVSFCLISGGLIFMASAHDVIVGMENYELDAMFAFNIMISLAAFLMAWTILVLAIKGWAVRREQTRLYSSQNQA